MTRRTMTWLGTAILATALATGTASAGDEKMSGETKMMDNAKKAKASEMTTVSVGKTAPDFTATDQHGHEISLSDFEGKVVVLEWTSPKCPFVQGHYSDEKRTMTTLAEKYAEQDVVWLAIDSSNFAKAKDLAAWSEDRSIEYPILVDADGSIGRTYGAKTTPHMFVIDENGKIAYEGAIDNNPRGKAENPTNYVEAALDAVLAGEKVATTSTKPYGCTVKYSQGA